MNVRSNIRPANLLVLLACVVLTSLSNAASLNTYNATHLFDLTSGPSGKLVMPSDVAVHAGRIYVVNSGDHRVLVYDSRGRYLSSIGGKGSAKGEFLNPVGIGIDISGLIYVADTGNHRIQVFDSHGRLQKVFPLKSGTVAVRPIDVAPGPKGKVMYVSSNNTHKMMKFTTDGRLLREWGGNGVEQGMFRYPATVAVGADGRIAVVDVLNTRTQVFNNNGEFSIQVGDWGVLPGQLFRPKGVAIDRQGRFYISDSYLELIQVFDDTGRFLAVLGKRGKAYRMTTPTGMVIDEHGRLYIAEMLGNKVSVYELEQ